MAHKPLAWDNILYASGRGFDSTINAIRCARSIQADLQKMVEKYGKKSEWNVVSRIALNHGQPMTRNEGFFEVAIQLARRLCMVAGPDQLVLSANLLDLYTMEISASEPTAFPSSVKILTQTEENFLHDTSNIVNGD